MRGITYIRAFFMFLNGMCEEASNSSSYIDQRLRYSAIAAAAARFFMFARKLRRHSSYNWIR